jgi:hypothetical protein
MARRGRQDALSTDPGGTLIYFCGPDFCVLPSEKCRDFHRGISSLFLGEPTPPTDSPDLAIGIHQSNAFAICGA